MFAGIDQPYTVLVDGAEVGTINVSPTKLTKAGWMDWSEAHVETFTVPAEHLAVGRHALTLQRVSVDGVVQRPSSGKPSRSAAAGETLSE